MEEKLLALRKALAIEDPSTTSPTQGNRQTSEESSANLLFSLPAVVEELRKAIASPPVAVHGDLDIGWDKVQAGGDVEFLGQTVYKKEVGYALGRKAPGYAPGRGRGQLH